MSFDVAVLVVALVAGAVAAMSAATALLGVFMLVHAFGARLRQPVAARRRKTPMMGGESQVRRPG